jgi:hypothetical protein
MKQTLLLLVAVLLLASARVSSQTIVNEARPVKSICTVSYQPVHPLVVVDDFETDMESMSLDPKNIESITILKNGPSTKKYGDKAKDGVIVITTKPNIQFFKITDFIDPSKDLNKNVSRIQLNGKILMDMSKLLIDKTAFTNSMISTECKAGNDLKSLPEETLVISTKFADKK